MKRSIVSHCQLAFFIIAILFGEYSVLAAQDWVRLTTNVSANLKGFYGVGDIAYAVGDGGTIVKTTNGGSTWVSLESGVSQNLWAVWFYHAGEPDEVGYAVGDDGIILKTSNGGASWESQISGLHTGTFQSFLFGIFPYDRQTWYATGGDGEAGGGVVLKTVDGGAHWTKSPVPEAFFLDKCFFTDALTGYAVGLSFPPTGAGIIVKTTDGGATWQQNYTTDALVSSLYCTGTDCYAVGNGGAIYTTTDGSEWHTQNSGITADLLSVHFANSQSGVISGDQGTVLRTADGGAHWNAINYTQPVFLNAVQIIGGSIFAAGNGGVILKLAETSGVGGQERKWDSGAISVYPNLLGKQTSLHVKQRGHIRACAMILYDMMGNIVRHSMIEGMESNISLAGLSAGSYLYVVSTDHQLLDSGQLRVE